MGFTFCTEEVSIHVTPHVGEFLDWENHQCILNEFSIKSNDKIIHSTDLAKLNEAKRVYLVVDVFDSEGNLIKINPDSDEGNYNFNLKGILLER
jgi:hypothetical protein